MLKIVRGHPCDIADVDLPVSIDVRGRVVIVKSAMSMIPFALISKFLNTVTVELVLFPVVVRSTMDPRRGFRAMFSRNAQFTVPGVIS